MNEVIDGHNIGMAKMGRLTRAEQATRRLLDSIEKLPAKARQAAEPLKVKLDSLQKELSYAEFAMNKWMDEFNMDSAVNNVKERIDYLEVGKTKSDKSERSDSGQLAKSGFLIKRKTLNIWWLYTKLAQMVQRMLMQVIVHFVQNSDRQKKDCG